MIMDKLIFATMFTILFIPRTASARKLSEHLESTSCLEQFVDGPQTATLVIQPIQTVDEDTFIWAVEWHKSAVAAV